MTEKITATISKALDRHGVAVVLSVVLVFWLMLRMDVAIVAVQNQIAEAKVRMTVYVSEEKEQREKEMKIWKQICINTSKTIEDTKYCSE